MRHPHHETARERQVAASRVRDALSDTLGDWFQGYITRLTATRQLRAVGMFEAEIKEALA